jgi:hypothetical protein
MLWCNRTTELPEAKMDRNLFVNCAEVLSGRRNVRPTGVQFGTDEMLVLDDRGRMTSGHFIEQKLRVALAGSRKRSKPRPK